MSRCGAADKIVILDRDGTMVFDREYLANAAGLEFQPWAAEGLRWLHSHGYRLVVITNQSGIGRGLITPDQMQTMNARLAAMVEQAGARLEGIYVCPHAPEAGCACRKPGQALMLLAAAELHFNPASATVIGDRETDIEFGRRAAARTILIAARTRSPDAPSEADLVAPNLYVAAQAITASEGTPS